MQVDLSKEKYEEHFGISREMAYYHSKRFSSCGRREPVNEAAIEQMKGELIDEEIAVAVDVSEITEEWEELTTPVNDETIEVSHEPEIAHSDERIS